MNQELNRVMRPFRARLTVEAAVRAVSVSGAFVLPVWLVLALGARILGWDGAHPAHIMGPLWAALALALYALRYRVSRKAAAKRMDALCGMDRMATAVEFEKRDGVLYRLQREDAVKRLGAIDKKALKIRLPLRAMAACLILLALVAAVPLLPMSAAERARAWIVQAVPGLEKQESEEALALRAMIEALEAEVESAGLKENDRAALLARLEEMRARLDEGMMDIAALQEIQLAMGSMQETVRELTPRDTYMAAMIEYESLRLLGEAIFDQNMDVVKMILDSFGRQLGEKEGMEQVNALMNLVYDINGSLAKPLRDNGQDQLRQGMMMFAGGLETAAEMVYNGRDNAKMIEAALDTAEIHIRDYLGVPEEGERYDPFANRVYEPSETKGAGGAAAAAVEEEKPLSPAETQYVYNPPPALKASSYVPGALDNSGEEQRLKAEAGKRPTGAVPYGEVYGEYYAPYLSALSGEGFPQALRETAEAYMNGL